MAKSVLINTPRVEYELVNEGQVQLVLADIEVRESTDQYGTRDKVYFWWLTAQLGTEEKNKGQMLPIFSQYTASLGEKASLRKVVTKLLGFDPGTEYDIGALIGTNAYAVIEHKENNDGTRIYANIMGNGTAILTLPKGVKKLTIPEGFTGYEGLKNKGVKKPGDVKAKANSAVKPGQITLTPSQQHVLSGGDDASGL